MEQTTMLVCRICDDGVFHIYQEGMSLNCPTCGNLMLDTNATVTLFRDGEQVTTVVLYEPDETKGTEDEKNLL